jgi:hypothetical protein
MRLDDETIFEGPRREMAIVLSQFIQAKANMDNNTFIGTSSALSASGPPSGSGVDLNPDRLSLATQIDLDKGTFL